MEWEPGLGAFEHLDDACVAHVFSKLGSRDLATAQQLNRRCRHIAEANALWRSPFATDFPHHYRALDLPQQLHSAPWRALYQQRRERERRWARGDSVRGGETLRAHSGPVFAARFLAPPFSPGLALSGGVYGRDETAQIALWDLEERRESTGRLVQQLDGEGMSNLGGVFDVKQVPGTQQVLLCGFSSEVNVASLLPTPSGGADSGGTSCPAAAAPPGSPVQAGRVSYALQHTHTLAGHAAACPAAACSKAGLAATASFDGTLRLWRIPEGPAAGSGEGGQTEECTATPSGTEVPNLAAVAVFRDPYTAPDNPIFHSTAVCGVALSTDAARLASGGNDMQVKQWDVETGKLALRLPGHEGWVWNLEALDDSHAVLISGGTDSTVRTWDTRAGRQVQRVNICTGTLYPVAGLVLRPPDQRYLVCGVFDGSVTIVDFRQMRVLHQLQQLHSDRVTRVSCHGDSILSASFDSNITLWSF